MNGMVSDRNEEECKPEKTKQQQKAHTHTKKTDFIRNETASQKHKHF